MTSVSKGIPYDLYWTYTDLKGAYEVSRSPPTPRISDGRIGSSIAVLYIPGTGFRNMGVGTIFNNLPKKKKSTDKYRVTVNTQVWYQGGFVNWLGGLGSVYGGLRVWVHTGGKIFQNTNYIYAMSGPIGLNFDGRDWHLRDISVTVEGSSTDPMLVFAETTQYVLSYSIPGGFAAVINLDIAVNSIVVSSIP
jgi:hypothetical protein